MKVREEALSWADFLAKDHGDLIAYDCGSEDEFGVAVLESEFFPEAHCVEREVTHRHRSSVTKF